MAGPSLEGLQIKFLAAYGRQEVLEGPAPEGVAIAEFPSIEEAKQWYESRAYQAAAQHRFKGCKRFHDSSRAQAKMGARPLSRPSF
jgi:uncharacterized protein (DUF1330 family)